MAVYDLQSPNDRERFATKAKEFAELGVYVELRRVRKARSLSQNAYMHLLIRYFASEFGYTEEQVKQDIFKRTCNAELFEEDVVNRRGCTVRRIRSSASLNSAEMTTAIERFRNYSSAECGLYLPTPDEREHIAVAMRQVDECKAYL